MTIFVNPVGSTYGKTATDGTLLLMGRRFHPFQRDTIGFVLSDISRLCGESSAPHLGQDVEITIGLLGHELFCTTDILFRVAPGDV